MARHPLNSSRLTLWLSFEKRIEKPRDLLVRWSAVPFYRNLFIVILSWVLTAHSLPVEQAHHNLAISYKPVSGQPNSTVFLNLDATEEGNLILPALAHKANALFS